VVRRQSIVALLAVFGAVVALVTWPQMALAAGASPIAGGGSSFAELEVDQWRADTAHAPYNLSVDYSAAGSTFGRTQYLAGQLDYGVSDIPFQPDEQGAVAASPRKNFVYVPVSAGGVAFIYNVIGTNGQRITNLRLTSHDVCRAFTEPNMFWDDPSVVASNPGVPLPHNPINQIVRSDGSGTSYVLSAYCITVAPDVWRNFISLIQTTSAGSASPQFSAGQPTSNWPIGYGNETAAYASDGVANAVASNISGANAITYDEAGFADVRGMPNALVQNAAGNYEPPDPGPVNVALAYATPRSDGTFTLNYSAPDPNAYFPSTYSYVIAQTTGFDPAKGATLGAFLNYAVTLGQKKAEALHYARLSDVLVNEALDHIQQIPGAPPRPTDLGAPPPPPQTPTGVGAGLRPPGSAAGGAVAGRGAAGGAAVKGGSGAVGGASANGSTAGGGSVTAGGATGATGGTDSNQVTENAEGIPSVNVKNLPKVSTADAKPASSSTPISNKDALWMFLLGFVVVGAGSLAGATSMSRSGPKASPKGFR